MQFSSLSEFFAMGGYGFFVWLSYSVGLFVLIGMWLVSRRSHKAQLQRLADFYQREAQQQNVGEDQTS